MPGVPPRSDAVRGLLLRVDRPAALGLAVVAVLAVLAAAWLGWHGRPHAVVYTGDGAASSADAGSARSPGDAAAPAASAASGTLAAATAVQEVVVDVAGRVRRPGLVRVPPGSRVWDAVVAAGGFTHPRDSALVNLARVLSDGEQIVIGPVPAGLVSAPGSAPGSVGGPASGSGGGGSAAAAPVDLNAADLTALEALPGVGPVLAQRILDHRAAQGPFRSVDELRDVSGIGDKKFADIAPHVRV